MQHHHHFDCHLVSLCIPPVLCVNKNDHVISAAAHDHINMCWNPTAASPFLLGQYKFGKVSMQLVLLVDALLLDAVPTFLLGNAQGTGDIISKVQPLLFCQIIS